MRFHAPGWIGLISLLALIGCRSIGNSRLKDENQGDTILINGVEPHRSAEILGLVPLSDPNLATGNCTSCHTDFFSIEGIKNKLGNMGRAEVCLNFEVKTDLDAKRVLACLSQLPSNKTVNPAKPAADISPAATEAGLAKLKAHDLGFFAAYIRTAKMKEVFDKAGMTNLYASTVAKAGMPPRGDALSNDDFAKVKKWLNRDTPFVDVFLKAKGPKVCNSLADSTLGSDLLEQLQTAYKSGNNWAARNKANKIKMFACEGDGAECFSQKIGGKDVFPLVPGVMQVSGVVRSLHEIDEATEYWTRSSADGRFTSYALPETSQSPVVIIDLLPKLSGNEPQRINLDGTVDPTFSPDNTMVMSQVTARPMTSVCAQSVLEGPDAEAQMSKGCNFTKLNVGLYQSVGSSLDEGAFTALSGQYFSDTGNMHFQDVPPVFTDRSEIEISKIQSKNGSYEVVAQKKIPTPFHGSWVMDPSQKFILGIVSGSTADQKLKHGGYRLIATDSDELNVEGTLPDWGDPKSGLICVPAGEKAAISFDERFIVSYAYQKQTEFNVKEIDSNSQLYAIDLLGDRNLVQLTNFPKGMYAKFPHFRSDGWLYFVLYDRNKGTRTIAATDAVVKLAAKPVR